MPSTADLRDGTIPFSSASHAFLIEFFTDDTDHWCHLASAIAMQLLVDNCDIPTFILTLRRTALAAMGLPFTDIQPLPDDCWLRPCSPKRVAAALTNIDIAVHDAPNFDDTHHARVLDGIRSYLSRQQ